MNKNRIIVGIVVILLIALVAFGVWFLRSRGPSEVLEPNTNTRIPGREILTPEEKKTATGILLEEEKQIGDPYYFFNFVGGHFDVIARSLPKDDMQTVIERTKSLIYELERMKNVTETPGLRDQVEFMLLRAKVFQEALNSGDKDLINAAFQKLKVIDTLREQLLEQERLER